MKQFKNTLECIQKHLVYCVFANRLFKWLRYLKFLLIIFFTKGTLVFGSNAYLRVNLHSHPVGMFSVFSYVAGILYEYETHEYAGIEVDFGNYGLYYDPEHGANWWAYYCKPICIGNKENALIREFNVDEFITYAFFSQRELNRQQVNALIKKYIHIQDSIQQKVDAFVAQEFVGQHIITVHYRGTDKIAEAPRIAFHKVSECINRYIRDHNLQKF